MFCLYVASDGFIYLSNAQKESIKQQPELEQQQKSKNNTFSFIIGITPIQRYKQQQQ